MPCSKVRFTQLDGYLRTPQPAALSGARRARRLRTSSTGGRLVDRKRRERQQAVGFRAAEGPRPRQLQQEEVEAQVEVVRERLASHAQLHREERRHAAVDLGEDRHPGREAPGAEPAARPAAARIRAEDQAPGVTSYPRRLAVAVAVVVALVLGAAPASAPAAAPPKPTIGAETAVVIDGKTGETLYAKRPNRRHAIASTTKIVTALVARDGADLTDEFTAS